MKVKEARECGDEHVLKAREPLQTGRLNKLREFIGERGLLWTLLFMIRYCGLRIVRRMEVWLIAIEKRRCITGESTVSSSSHSREQNRYIWDNYDWSRLGEEWTHSVERYRGLNPEQWKTKVINGIMLKYIKKDSTVLEIGPGAGRWTEILLQQCSRLLVADISQEALEICRERFAAHENIDYLLIDDRGLGFLPASSIDYVWAYDVFVHINPADTERYISDFSRLLKPGGVAIIHHPGTYASEYDAKEGFRSFVDARLFAHLVEKYGMRLIEQDDALPHKPGDVISVFSK